MFLVAEEVRWHRFSSLLGSNPNALFEVLTETFWLRVFCPLTWPWLTVAALLVFQASMRRGRIRSEHMIRCVVYCFDLTCLWMVPAYLAAAVACLVGQYQFPGVWLSIYVLGGVFLVWFLTVLLAAARLARAVSGYLRFDHPIATVLSTQVIVALIEMNIFVLLAYLAHR
ncbi:MAG: hypothetical protein JXQ73_32255 [Phycisphaerae bacterium]|nr:hypothetical protein [Phycisphaerae bacterium]